MSGVHSFREMASSRGSSEDERDSLDHSSGVTETFDNKIVCGLNIRRVSQRVPILIDLISGPKREKAFTSHEDDAAARSS
jgi:hypothetical protein